MKSDIKEYIINNPKKCGFKIRTRADEYGYVLYFEMYSGASTSVNLSHLGPVGHVVSLCQDIAGVNHW